MHPGESLVEIVLTECPLGQLDPYIVAGNNQSLHSLLNGIIWHSVAAHFIKWLQNLWGSGIHPRCSAGWRVIPHSSSGKTSQKDDSLLPTDSQHWLPDLQLETLSDEFLHQTHDSVHEFLDFRYPSSEHPLSFT